ncbi:hypothetical protein KEM48_013304 [Puccinia striiformis f. sp. tritici PST-130]|uniref:Secreted protein n=1 Tax=Puccinia striiformis f. sp. tritici PST-78 TaxID=1165861 RepID=A0A0L0VD60_9BASI|nr:hypothetical protein Pst134EB_024008 [Puccinia striiformis f. sp. tritici]KAI9631048.1 hypothetical protein KEM48_013304 [Puccinia striiformis f. sp. tritici PST-130]KNE97242.1 hypothetical protein PSTG_09505 [Puccinia striiformis f. sp. tritici PST-78]
MIATQVLLLCLIGLIALDFGMARTTNVKRSGSFPGSMCTATLKNSNHQNAKKIHWQFWKPQSNTWQVEFKQGATELVQVTLLDDSNKQCSATFMVDQKPCTIYHDPKSPITATSETEKHISQPSPIVAPGETTTGLIAWSNCPAGMSVHVDF